MSKELNEGKITSKFDEKAEMFMKKHRSHMEALEKSPLAKVRSLRSMDYYAVGSMLEQWDTYKHICENTGSLNALGSLPTIAHDVITAVYGASILPIIASVQPIEDEQGLVYFKQVRGPAGNVLMDPRTGAKTPVGMSTNKIINNNFATTASGDVTYTIALGTTVRAQSLKLSLNANVFCEDVGPRGADKNIGALLGAGMSGTVNYATGVVDVVLSADPAGAFPIKGEYQVNFETSTDLKKISTYLDSKLLKAEVYALKGTVGLLAQYSMQKRFGKMASDELAQDLVLEINKEIGGDIIKKLRAGASDFTKTEFSRTPEAGVSQFEHRQAYKYAQADAEAQLLAQAGRGVISTMIVGSKHASFIKGLPGFKPLSDGNTVGAHVWGQLDGVTYVRVPESDVLGVDEGVGIYKGQSPFEAPCVFAPYMPLTVTDMLPETPNPLINQRAAATMAAVDVTVKNFATCFDLVA